MSISSRAAAVLPALFFVAASSFGQSFNGRFVNEQQGALITLDLSQNEAGDVTGTLAGSDGAYRLTGKVEEGVMVGVVSGGQGPGLGCRVTFDDPDHLRLVLYPRDAGGAPVYAMGRTIILTASRSEAGSP